MKLSKRLATLQSERSELQAEMKTLQASLKVLFALPRPPTSLPVLHSRLAGLEQSLRVTQPLSAEKKALKDMDRVKEKIREGEKFKEAQEQIDEYKSQLDSLRSTLSLKTPAIDQLRSAVSRLSLCASLNLPSLSSLVTETVECGDRLSRVIGKGGERVKALEKKWCVRADAKDGVLTVSGGAEGVAGAVKDVTDVVETQSRPVTVGTDVGRCLILKLESVIDPLRATGVRIGSVKGDQVTVEGTPTQITDFEEAAKGLDVQRSTITCDLRDLGVVIGPKGARIKALEAMGTKVEVFKGDEPSVTILGKSEDVERVRGEVEVVIHENSVVEDRVPVSGILRGSLLKDNGSGIKAICAGGGWARLDKSDVVIKGTRAEVDKAARALKEKGDEVDATVTVIELSKDILPAVVGKGGGDIKKARKELGVNMEVDFAQEVVRVQGDDEEGVAKAVEWVREIERKNYTRVVPLGDNIGLLLGAKGKEVREGVMAKCKLEVVQDTKDVRIRGTEADVVEAVASVTAFLENNYTVNYEVAEEDKKMLLQGGGESVVKVLSRRGVEVQLRRDSNDVRIRGKKAAVEEALAELKKAIFGGDGVEVTDVPVGDDFKGALIGKGGANIKDIEVKHGVKVQVLDSSGCFRLRGAGDAVKAATRVIESTILNQKITRMVDLSDKTADKAVKALGHKGVLAKRLLARGVAPKLQKAEDGSAPKVRLKGFPKDVAEGERFIKEFTGEVFSMKLEMDAKQISRAGGSDSPHWLDITDQTGAKVEFTSDGIVLKGVKKQVADAVTRADAFLTFALGGEMARVELPVQAVAFAFSPFDLVEMERESGCRLQKDYFTSCLRIRGEDVAKAEELVEEKMKVWTKSHFAMPVPPWATSLVLGRKGETINAIRDETGVEIDLDSEANTITLHGETESIAKAKAAIETIIEENKVFVEEIELPEDSKGSFIGKGGANIKVMQDGLEGVAFELGSSGSSVRVKGLEEGVKEGKERVEKWIEEYEEKNFSSSLFCGFVGALVGPKGETIRGLETDHNVKITVLKDAKETGENVVVRGLKEDVEKAKDAVAELGEKEEAKAEERRKEQQAQREAAAVSNIEQKKREDDVAKTEGEQSQEPVPGPKKNVYAAVPVGVQGGGAFSQVLSKAARKRLNKKNRAESEAKMGGKGDGAIGEEGEELLNLLVAPTSPKASSPKTSSPETSSLKEGVASPEVRVAVPPPPGLGFTPTSSKNVKKSAFNALRDDEMKETKTSASAVGRQDEDDEEEEMRGDVEEKEEEEDDDEEEEEEEIIVSRSGFSIRF